MEEIMDDLMAKEQAQMYIDDAKKLVSKASGLLDCAVRLGGTEELNSEEINKLEQTLDDVSDILAESDRLPRVVDKKLISLGIAANVDFKNDGRVCLSLTALAELCNLVEYGISEYIGERLGTSNEVAKDTFKPHDEKSLRDKFLKEGRKYGS